MRILHLVSYPLFSGPMPGTLALALAQRRLGHAVWLACDSRRGNFNGFEEAAEPHLADLELAPPLPRPLTLSTKASLSELWKDYRGLRGLLQSGQVDVVHAHLSHDHALAALCKSPAVPLVRTIHAARGLGRRFGQGWLMRRANQFIVRCQAHARTLEAAHAQAQNRITAIPGSIEAHAWRLSSADASTARAAWRARYHIPDSAPVLGHVALIAGRGQQTLVDALCGDTVQSMARLHVLFVGDGEEAQALKAQVAARNLGHRVHFTGYLQATQLKEVYAAMDAAMVMQPGNDAAARAALEAMAAGLAVFSPETEALGELVSEANGYPLKARTPQALRAALEGWLIDQETGRARGATGARHVATLRNIEREAEATLTVYRRATV